MRCEGRRTRAGSLLPVSSLGLPGRKSVAAGEAVAVVASGFSPKSLQVTTNAPFVVLSLGCTSPITGCYNSCNVLFTEELLCYCNLFIFALLFL